MSQKLSTITPTYHSFTKDQLLTHNDLNEVIDYFGDQDRLARICLSGVGIVCGFKISKEVDTGGTEFIQLTQGSGLTTDGDLMHLLFDNNDGTVGVADMANQPSLTKIIDSIKLTKFRGFTDSEAKYPQFEGLTLFELIPDSVNGSDIFTGNNNEFNFNNRTIVLYLDCYSNEPGACTSISCDSQGIEQVQQVRVLVIDDENLYQLTNPDYLFNSRNVIDEFINLNEVEVPRVVLNQENADDVTLLASDYNNAAANADLISNLSASISTIAARVNYDSANIIGFLGSIFDVTASVPLKFQYRYDLLKDVVDSYHEITDLFIEQYPICCPDIFAFPKHLLLGKLGTEDLAEEDNLNRHGFYPSPILTNKYNAREHLAAILDRIELMLSNYIGDTTITSGIKITPSTVRTALGNRSIPFYYDPQYDSNSQSELVKVWDFERGTLRQYNRILGYHQSLEEVTPVVTDPLKYNLDSYNFFRIEGLHGQRYRDALEEINLQKEEYGLAFDTKALGITVDDTETVDLNEYLCEFQDLSALLEACIDEQECILGEASFLLSAFSNSEEGTNHNRAEAMGRTRSFLSPDFKLTLGSNLQSVKGDLATTRPAGELPIYDQSIKESDFGQEVFRKSIRSERNQEIEQISKFQEFEYSKSIQSYAEIQTKERVIRDELIKINIKIKDETVQEDIDLTGFEYSVIRNLYIEDDGIGRIIFDAFIEAEGYQSSDTYSYMKTEFDALTQSGGSAESWDADLKNVMLYLPGQIMASAYAISLLIPTGLTAINSDSIENYKRELDKLCSYARQYQALHRKVSKRSDTALETGLNTDVFSLIELLNNSLTDLCCVDQKLQSLLDLVEERKLKILAGLKLTNFILDHPGLEHKAGVQPGGTFVIVYALNESGSGLVQDGTVIADFALPYLCCSDCAPINFIVPKEKVSLSLPTSVHCIGSDPTGITTYEMTVIPVDGSVATVGTIPGITIAGNMLSINNAEFDPTKLATPIKFTVNEQFTEAFIIVRQTAEVQISTNPVIDPNVATTESSFTFTALDTQPGDVITWNFGDGTAIGQGSPISHEFSLPPVTNPITVTLTVTPANGACPATATQTIDFGAIVVSIDQTVFCLNDDPIALNIEPDGANPDITGIGITADKKSFDPGLTAGQTGPFLLYNDGIQFASVSVEEPASAEIRTELSGTDRTITISAETNNSSSHTWNLLDGSSGIPLTDLENAVDFTTEPIVIPYELIGNPGTRIVIQLTAQSATSACDEVIVRRNFTVPDIKVEETVVSIGQDIFCINDAPYPLTVTPDGITPEVAGVGITADQLFFDPALTVGKTGPFRLYHKGAQFASVQVVQPQAIEINSVFVVKNRVLNLAAVAEGADEILWSFLDPQTNAPLPDFDGKFDTKSPTLVLPVEVFGQPGKSVKVRLMAQFSKNRCKESLEDAIFTVVDDGVLERFVPITKGDDNSDTFKDDLNLGTNDPAK